ncbi:MAG TPA: hypothetical protein VF062_01455 [Candidatus Limnocylindrales bacterium]
MSARKRAVLASVAVGMLVVVGLAGPANAAGRVTGQTLGVGDIRCTDRVLSDNGARATGFLNGGLGEWTVRRADPVTGAETVVFRQATGSLFKPPVPLDKIIAPAAPGAFLYRQCISISRITKPTFFSATHYEMELKSSSPNAVFDIGPEPATRSLYARACGDKTAVPGNRIRLVGSGNRLVQWLIAPVETTNNFEGTWFVLYTPAISIDQTLELDPEILAVSACAAHGEFTEDKLTVSFELSTS